MPKIIRYFLIATSLTGIIASAASAAEVPVVQAPAAQDARDAVLAEQAPDAQSAPATQRPAEKEASPVPEASTWTMLLVGAGVLLLPRRRRQDNKIR